MPSVSSEGVTPRSSLVRAHVPLPLVSLLLRHLASFEASWQVVHSPCCPGELPDVISENPSLDAGSRATAVPPSALTCFFPGVIGLPRAKIGSASRFDPRITTPRGSVFSRLQIFLYVPASKFAHPPDRPYRCAILPQGSRGFCLRAYRVSLPPHAPDMLTVRIQAIDGTGTFTLPDSQPCRLLTSLHGHYSASALLRTPPPPSRRSPTSRLWPVIRFPAPPVSRRDEEGFSSCFAHPCHRAVATIPPECLAASASCNAPCCLGSTTESSVSGVNIFGATCAFTFVTAR